MSGDLVERLRAEMNEVERQAAECYRSPWPTHVLHTVRAHRKIIELHEGWHTCREMQTVPATSGATLRPEDQYFDDEEPCPTVEALASIYFPDDQS